MPQTADVTLKSDSGQQPKLQEITSRRITPMTTARPQKMSHFDFSRATASQQQHQQKEKCTYSEDKSKALPDYRSTDVNGTHSKPTLPQDAAANREESAFFKDKGNMAFKAQKWEVAAEAYSRWAAPVGLPLKITGLHPFRACSHMLGDHGSGASRMR